MEEVGTFTALAQTNSRAGDDDTGQVEDETVQMEASYSGILFDKSTGRMF